MTDACNVVFGLMIWKLSRLSTVTCVASWFWPLGTFCVTAELKRAKTWKWIQSPSYSKAPARSLTSSVSPFSCIVCLMCSQQPWNLFSQLKSSAKVEEEHNTVSSLWTLVKEESAPPSHTYAKPVESIHKTQCIRGARYPWPVMLDKGTAVWGSEFSLWGHYWLLDDNKSL